MKRVGVPGGAPRRTNDLRTRHIPVLLSKQCGKCLLPLLWNCRAHMLRLGNGAG
jgi:hypothetical protein